MDNYTALTALNTGAGARGFHKVEGMPSIKGSYNGQLLFARLAALESFSKLMHAEQIDMSHR